VLPFYTKCSRRVHGHCSSPGSEKLAPLYDQNVTLLKKLSSQTLAFSEAELYCMSFQTFSPIWASRSHYIHLPHDSRWFNLPSSFIWPRLAYIKSRFIRLLFSARTVFFSHNNLVLVYFQQISVKRTGPLSGCTYTLHARTVPTFPVWLVQKIVNADAVANLLLEKNTIILLKR